MRIRVARRFTAIAIAGFFVILFFLLSMFFFSYQSVRSEMKAQILQVLENRTLVFQESFKTIIEQGVKGVELLVALDIAEAPNEVYREKIIGLIRTTKGCMNIMVSTAFRTIDFPLAASEASFQQVSELQKRFSLTPVVQRRDVTSSYQFLSPRSNEFFTDVILPVEVIIRQGNEIVGLSFIEFNLSRVLGELNQLNRIRIGDNQYPMEYSLFTKHGDLLESSINRGKRVRRSIVEIATQALVIHDLSNQLYAEKKDHLLDLIFVVDVPLHVVNDVAKNTALRLVFLGLAVLCVCLILGALLFKQLFLVFGLRRREIIANFHALQMKMNPHFLFNTINQIVCLVERKETDETLYSLRSLTHILHVMIRERGEIITVIQEIECISHYITLQRLHYKDKFTIDFFIDEQVHNAQIVKLCLQPIIENCFIHGMTPNKEGVLHISIKGEIVDSHLSLMVTDDGAIVDNKTIIELQQRLKETRNSHEIASHIGLESIQRRIHILYGDSFGLCIHPMDIGFCVELKLPLIIDSTEETIESISRW